MKVGFKGVFIIRTCFPDVSAPETTEKKNQNFVSAWHFDWYLRNIYGISARFFGRGGVFCYCHFDGFEYSSYCDF